MGASSSKLFGSNRAARDNGAKAGGKHTSADTLSKTGSMSSSAQAIAPLSDHEAQALYAAAALAAPASAGPPAAPLHTAASAGRAPAISDDPICTAPVISAPRCKRATKNLPYQGPKIDHKNLPQLKPENAIAPCWALSEGAQGGGHSVVSCGIPMPHNYADLVNTSHALKLLVAEPCPEIDVLLSVSNKLMDTQTSCATMWGGPSDGKSWMCNATTIPPGLFPWEEAGCPWDLLVPYPALMVVEDLTTDARLSHLPHAGFGIRTYLSSPVIASDGHRLGSYCMVDFRVHKIDIGRCRLLTNFAELASRELERYADVQERLLDENDPVHAAYMASSQVLKRNLASSYDSCIMVINVNNNFEVLYVNQSWVQWSGGQSRDHIVGQHLPEVLESVTTIPLTWSQFASDAVGGARFIVPRVRARGPGVITGNGAVFDISFRCGALEPLDNDTLPIALPTFVDLSTHHGGIYFGRLHAQDDSSCSYHPLDALRSASASTMTPGQMARLVIPELKLGQVLGQGGYATAYVAEWHDTRVVCKVQDHILRNDKQRALAEGEIALGQELCHPNVIRTLAHNTIQLQRPLPAAVRWAPHNNDDEHLDNLADYVDYHVGDYDECDYENFAYDSNASSASQPKMQYISLHNMQADYSTGVADWQVAPANANNASVNFTSIAARAAPGSGNLRGSFTSAPNVRSHLSVPPKGIAAASAATAAAAGDQAPGSQESVETPLYPGMRTASGSEAHSSYAAYGGGGDSLTALDSTGRVNKRALMASLQSYGSVTSATSVYQYPVELRSFLVIEFCDKGCLQDAIDRGWLREARHGSAAPVAAHVVRTAMDIAEGMQYLHSKHIIHGDLSPFNILLTSIKNDAKLRGVEEEATVDEYGRAFVAKVADFGSSRRLPLAQEYIRTESYATVTHMPPEMLSNSQMGFACDVWAFGVLLWSMWTGSRPWTGLSHAQIVAVVVDRTRSLQFPPGMPPTLERLGRSCLAHDAADRPSFDAICAALRMAMAELGPTDL